MKLRSKLSRIRGGQLAWIAAPVLTGALLSLANTAGADQVTDWNTTLTTAIRASGDLPPVAGRKAAIVHVAIYDAVNGITRQYEPYFVNAWAQGGARAEAAAAQAAYTTLLAMYPAQKDSFDAQLAASLASIAGIEGDSQSMARGLAWGAFVADQVLQWRSGKYTYNFWRPYHAIRLADLDGNPDTIADPDWEPLVPTPNHQEYISFHSVVSGAIFRVAMNLLGDEHTFTILSPALPGIAKEYHSFSEAIAEVKEARIYGGMHFRNSCDVGQHIGYAYADYLVTHFLQPRHNHGRQAGY